MNAAIARVLNTVLGEYLENLNAEQLNVSVFSGIVELSDLRLKKELISMLGLPLQLEHGVVGSLKVTIPWTSLTSKPLQIEISDVVAVVRPRPLAEWNEQEEVRTAHAAKQSALTQFEAVAGSELAVSGDPGFTERLVTKIVDNIEVALKRVYIHYEDAVTSDCVFSLGVCIHEIKAFTCDNQWNRKFMADQPVTYKAVQLNHFHLFLDHTNVEPTTDFAQLAKAEFNSQLAHRYIIEPTGFTLLAILNKNPKLLESPQIAATIKTEGFRLSIETRQTTHLLGVLELLTLFQRFQQGVQKSLPQDTLEGQPAAEYRELYKKFKILSTANKAAEAAATQEKLKEVENSCSFESICANRAVVHREIEIQRKEEAVRKKIEEAQAPQEGAMSRLVGYFWGKSEAPVANKETDTLVHGYQQQLSEIVHTKNELYAQLEELIKDTPQFVEELPPEYVKISVILDVPEFALVLKDEHAVLLEAAVEQVRIEGGLRKETVFAKLEVESSHIAEEIPISARMPEILVGGPLAITYDQLPNPRVQLTTESFTLYVNVPALVKLANAFLPAVSGKIDWGPILEYASQVTTAYIESGQQYVEELLKQGVQSSITLDIQAKAPVFVIPLNVASPAEGLLVFDLGTLQASSDKTIKKGAEHDEYVFELKNTQTLRVLGAEYAADWRTAAMFEVIKPVNYRLQLFTCKAPGFPNMSMFVAVTSTTIVIDEDVVGFLITLMNQTLAETAKLESSQAEAPVQSENQAVEHAEAYKDRIKGYSNTVDFKLAVSFEALKISLFKERSRLAQLEVGGSLLRINISSDLKVNGAFKLSHILLEDQREGIALRYLLFNPQLLLLEDEDEFVDAREENQLVTVEFSFSPKDDSLEVVAVIEDIRLVPHPEFFGVLLQYFTSQMQTLEALQTAQPEPPPVAQQPASEYETFLRRSFSVTLTNFEVWLPLDNQNPQSPAASFQFSLNARLESSQVYCNQFDSAGVLLATKFLRVDDDALLELGHIRAIIGSIEGHSVVLPSSRQQELLEPSRISMSYRCTQAQGSEPNTVVSVNFESFSALVGFRDYRFVTKAMELWSSAKVEQPTAPQAAAQSGSMTVSFECDALQLSIINDTEDEASLLAYLSMSNLFGAATMTTETKAKVSVYVALEFYNPLKASWEPLIEDWCCNIQYEQGQDTTVQLYSESFLNISLSLHMAEILGTLYKKFFQDDSYWEQGKGGRQRSQKIAMFAYRSYEYELRNELGVPAQVWVDTPVEPEIWEVEDSVRFTQEEINRILSKSSAKLIKPGILEEVRAAATLAVHIEGYTVVKKLVVEKLHTAGFKLKNEYESIPCVITVESNQGERVITLQTVTLVVNELSFPLTLKLQKKELHVPEYSSVALPLTWSTPENITIEGVADSGVFTTPNYLTFQSGHYAAKSVVEKKVAKGVKRHFIVFSPPVTIVNGFPYNLSWGRDTRLRPGKSAPLEDFDLSSGGTLRFSLDLGESPLLETQDVEVTADIQEFTGLPAAGAIPCSKLVMKVAAFTETKFPKKSQRLLLSRSIEVYAQFIIVNRTARDVVCGRKTKLQLKPNSLGFFRSSRHKLQIKTTNPKTEWSNGFDVKTVGVSGCVILKNTSGKTPKAISYGVRMHEAPLPMTKTIILYIQPRFVIANRLPFPVFVRQLFKHKPGQHIVQIAPQSSEEYQLENGLESKVVQISRNGEHWSSSFMLDEIDDFLVKVEALEEEKQDEALWYEPHPANRFMHIARVIVNTQDEATLFISLVVPSEPEFLIHNNTNKELKIRQGKRPPLFVAPQGQLAWIFDERRERRVVKMKIGKQQGEFAIEKIRKFPSLGKFHIEVVITGGTRVVRVYRQRDSFVGQEQAYDTQTVAKYSIDLKGIGVSIIDQKPSERFFLTLADLQMDVVFTDKSGENVRESLVEFDFIMKSMQLDNMHTNNSLFPVVFCPTKADDSTPFLQVKLHKLSTFKAAGQFESVSMDKYPWLEVAIQEMTLRLNQDVIFELLALSDKLQKLFFLPKDYHKLASSSFAVTDICPDLDTACPALSDELAQASQQVYFQFVRLGAIKVVITFRVATQEEAFDTTDFPLFTLFSSLGKSFANITESALPFNELIFQHSFKTLDSLTALITQNYTRQGILQFYRLLGSSDLIGNPVGLIDKLGTGVFEFINEPTKGLLQGPAGFAAGIGKGVKSLVGNVVSAGFGSVSKVTGSLFNIVQQVSGEEQAELLREGNNGLATLGAGFKGGAKHLLHGVTGIFTKPFEGAKKGGYRGFFIGMGKGVVGLVMAPVGAALRIGAGITGGIADVGTLIARGKVTKRGRARFPRYISERGVVERYNSELAQAQELLRTLENLSKEKMVFYLHLLEREDLIIILTLKHLIVLVDGDVSETVKVKDIRVCEVHKLQNFFYIAFQMADKQLVIRSKKFNTLAKLYCAVLMVPNKISSHTRLESIQVQIKHGKCC